MTNDEKLIVRILMEDSERELLDAVEPLANLMKAREKSARDDAIASVCRYLKYKGGEVLADDIWQRRATLFEDANVAERNARMGGK